MQETEETRVVNKIKIREGKKWGLEMLGSIADYQCAISDSYK